MHHSLVYSPSATTALPVDLPQRLAECTAAVRERLCTCCRFPN
jgi:hypothetical protein